MQTDLGREVDARTLTASYIYAARYGYSDTVVSNDNQLRIFPRDGEGQIPLQSQLWTLPEGRGVEYGDRFGNRVRRVRVVEQHTSLVVATVGQVSLSIEPPFPDDLDLEDVANIPDRLEYTMRSPLVDPEAVAVLAQHVAGSADSWMGRVRNVTDWVYWHIRYKRGSTDVSPVNGSFVSKGGSDGVCGRRTGPVRSDRGGTRRRAQAAGYRLCRPYRSG